jgi:glycosyltransferase involved in cell wall biosynthesis
VRILIATDAWHPQVNGVVRTLATTADHLARRGHRVDIVSPDQFRTVPLPSYPEIRLALGCGRGVAAAIERFAPDAVHIATEGPIGWAARGWCLHNGHPFSTSFHTHFPDYLSMRTGLPPGWFWPPIRRFHTRAESILVATHRLASDLAERGLTQTRRWSRGVDTDLFRPDRPALPMVAGLPRPIQLYVGRVAIEKNLEAFLDCATPGSKVIVGEGPARAQLMAGYPEAHFLGALIGETLASAYASADVFVFPSLTDTFGLVIIEALASGVPVAAFPVQGPLDILGEDGCGQGEMPIGALDADLSAAIQRALLCRRDACVAEARRYGWDACTDQFLAGLTPAAPARIDGCHENAT